MYRKCLFHSSLLLYSIYPDLCIDASERAGDIDGSLSGRSITVDPGSATGTLTITAVDDSVEEGDKTMTVTLGTLPDNADSTAITLANGVSNSFTITITYDDATPTQVTGFAITSGVLPITEDGSDSVTVTLTLNSRIPAGEGALAFPYILAGANITVTDITVGGQPITSLTTGTISVAEGSNTGTLVIAGRQDTTDEGVRETLTVTLGTLPNNSAGTPLTDASGVTNIMIRIDDDDGLTVRLTRSPADGQLTEGGANGVFTLDITGITTGADTVGGINVIVSLTGTNAAAADVTVTSSGDLNAGTISLIGNPPSASFGGGTGDTGNDGALTSTWTIDPNEDGDTTPETVTLAFTEINFIGGIPISLPIPIGDITGPGVSNGMLTFTINDND